MELSWAWLSEVGFSWLGMNLGLRWLWTSMVVWFQEPGRVGPIWMRLGDVMFVQNGLVQPELLNPGWVGSAGLG